MTNQIQQHLLEALPFAVIWVNNQGVVDWMNKEAVRILEGDWHGHFWNEVMQQCFEDMRLDGFEVATQNGQLLQVYLSTVEGTPGQLITLVDMTSSRTLQRHLAHQQRVYTVGQMTAQLAHQIRTPLASSILLTERIARLCNDEQCRSMVDKLKDCHQSIEKQIQHLLAYCRGENLTMEKINIQDWLTQWQLQAETHMDQSVVDILLDFEIAPEETMVANQEALTGCLFNLLDNALQAEASCIKIKVYAIWDSLVAIDFQDNGHGISQSLVDKVKEPFYTSKAKGTGLGLAVVESVINQHGGTVSIESEQGSGFFVRFILPVKDDTRKDNASNTHR